MNTVQCLRAVSGRHSRCSSLLRASSENRSWCRSLFSVLEGIAPQRVPLVKDRYPTLKRKDYAKVTSKDVSRFCDILSNDRDRVVTDAQRLIQHSCDWLKTLRGESPLMLFPQSVDEVKKILSYCYEKNLAVTVQGGKTSMVGASIPIFDEIIVNTSLMNSIDKVDEISGVVTCGPGATLDQLDEKCTAKGLLFPVDYNIRQSQIGGCVAADIAGPRTMRFGTLHANVTGLEVVLPDGTVLDSMTAMKKDNTGYDLKQIFIGSEGTLGVITKIAVNCPTRPAHVNLAMVSCDSFEKVLEVFVIAQDVLGEIISACEFYDSGAAGALKRKFLSLWRIPEHPFSIMVETMGSHDPHDEAKLEKFMDLIKEKNLIVHGVMARKMDQVKQMWQFYNRILTSLVTEGYVHQFDVSLPQKKMYPLVVHLRERLGKDVQKVVGYGHLYDGNLDLSVVCRQYDARLAHKIETLVYEYVQEHNGAISAELGCGFKYRNLSHFSKSGLELVLQRKIKDLFDPKGIMNPYKVLPDV